MGQAMGRKRAALCCLAAIVLGSCQSLGLQSRNYPFDQGIEESVNWRKQEPCGDPYEMRDGQLHNLNGWARDLAAAMHVDLEDQIAFLKRLNQHIIVVDEDGRTRRTFQQHCYDTFASRLDPIMAGLAAYQLANDPDARSAMPLAMEERTRVIMFAHGGRVSQKNAVAEAAANFELILEDGYHRGYPIFLVWHTNDVEAYADQAFWVQDGIALNRLAPIKGVTDILSDIGRGVTGIPNSYRESVVRFRESEVRRFLQEATDASDAMKGEEVAYDPTALSPYMLNYTYPNQRVCEDVINGCDQSVGPEANVVFPPKDFYGPDINGDDDVNDPKVSSLRFATYQASTPLTALLLPAIDAFGGPSWRNMVRRSRNTVRRPSEFDLPKRSAQMRANQMAEATDEPKRISIEDELELYPSGTGGFGKLAAAMTACFLMETPDYLQLDIRSQKTLRSRCSGVPERFAARSNSAPRPVFSRLTFTLAGHSMGAIIHNELVQLLPQDFPVRDVVYMGAAASIDDIERASARYLIGAPHEHDRRLYSLMLHPLSETRELNLGGITPQGSLLEWIDERFENPETPRHRTFGKWRNLRQSKHVFSCEAQERMVFRVFPSRAGEYRDRDRLLATHPQDSACLGPFLPPDAGAEGLGKLPPAIAGLNALRAQSCYPTKHGQFSAFAWWRPAYWTGERHRPAARAVQTKEAEIRSILANNLCSPV
jgi:pimeloyl-ACP methyl ester carboxylesterase